MPREDPPKISHTYFQSENRQEKIKPLMRIRQTSKFYGPDLFRSNDRTKSWAGKPFKYNT